MDSPTNNTFNPKEHPWYFGAALNSCRHNVYLVLSTLEARYEADIRHALAHPKRGPIKDFQPVEEEQFGKCHLINKDYKLLPDEIRLKVWDDLRRHFRFLNVFHEKYLDALKAQQKQQKGPRKKGKDKKDKIKPDEHIWKGIVWINQMLQYINALRNHFSHTWSELNPSQEIIPGLQTVFDAAPLALWYRYEGKEIFTKDMFKRFHPKSAGEKFHYHLVKQNGYLTVKGLSFLICLLSPAKTGNEFLSRIYGFKDTRTKERLLSRKVFTIFSLQLPYDKLESSDIFLDLINELARCPSPLFRLLPEAQRQRFVAQPESDPDQDSQETELTEAEPQAQEEENPSEIPPLATLKRYGNRFPFFALRYLDDTQALPQMRFQLYLGRNKDQEYDKRVAGQVRRRAILRDLKAFGRWLDFQPEKAPFVKPINGVPHPNSWRTRLWRLGDDPKAFLMPSIDQFSPKYQITGNRIAIKFVEPEEDGKWPSFAPSQKGVQQANLPDAILSTHELGPLCFLHHLHQKGLATRGPEETIRSFISRFRRCCADIESGQLQPVGDLHPDLVSSDQRTEQENALYQERFSVLQDVLMDNYQLYPSHLPDNLRQHLLGFHRLKTNPNQEIDPNYRAAALKTLLRMRKEARYRLKILDLKLEREKPGRRLIKAGELAEELSRDIIYFQRPTEGDHGGKATDIQYKTLQAMLAMWGAEKDRAARFMDLDLGLIAEHSETVHPFLYKIRLHSQRTIIHLYRSYMDAKIKWLSNLIQGVEDKGRRKIGTKRILEEYEYFLKALKKIKRPKNYDQTVVMLPKGLFNIELRKALAEPDPTQEATQLSYPQGIDHFLEGDQQEFYHWTRLYLDPENWPERDLTNLTVDAQIKLLQEKISGFPAREELQRGEEDLAHPWRRKLRKILKSESLIRFERANDQLSWLLARETLTDSSRFNREIGQTGWQLSKLGFHLSSGRDEGQVRVSHLDQVVEMQIRIGEKIIYDQQKIKDYGRFRKRLKDRRIPGLLKFIPAQRIPASTIANELEDYEKIRIEFFRAILDFEATFREQEGLWQEALEMQASMNAANASRQEDLKHVSHHVLLHVLANRGCWLADSRITIDHLKHFRNKFFHNEFLNPDALEAPIDIPMDPDSETSLSTQIGQFCIGLYQQLNALIPQEAKSEIEDVEEAEDVEDKTHSTPQ